MRTRLLIPAAIAAAATYAALIRDDRRATARVAGDPPAAPPPAPAAAPIAAAPSVTDRPVPISQPGPEVVPAAPAAARPGTRTVLDEGRFALGGWAAAPGHSVVSAVTFHRRLAEPATAARIIIDLEASENVPEGGLIVLDDPGFAPDREGFTLLLAAADPGPFSAAGSYRVVA